MSYTPVELKHVHLARAPFGYRRSAVDGLLEEVAESFEQVWRERGEIGDRVEELERELEELRGREDLLVRSLVAAEQAAADTREHAKREAELIIAEAHVESRSITRGAQGEHARLAAEVRRIETLLRAALGVVEEGARELPAEAEPEAPAKVREAWPRREDTREFPRRVGTAPALPAEPEAQAG